MVEVALELFQGKKKHNLIRILSPRDLSIADIASSVVFLTVI